MSALQSRAQRCWPVGIASITALKSARNFDIASVAAPVSARAALERSSGKRLAAP